MIEHRESLLGEEHPHTVLSRYWLGAAVARQGRFSAARDVLAPLVPVARRILGEGHSYTLKAEIELAKALVELGARPEAERIAAGVEERIERRDGTSAQSLRAEAKRIRRDAAAK